MCLLFVLQMFAIHTYADNLLYRTTNLCWNDQRLKLKKDFTYEIWVNDILRFEGTWEFDGDEAIIMHYEIEDEYENEAIEMYLQILQTDEAVRLVVPRGSQDHYIYIIGAEFQDEDYTLCD